MSDYGTTSTVPAIKSFIRDLLTNSSALEGVQISWSPAKQIERRALVIGNAQGDATWAQSQGSGRGTREENYAIDLFANVQIPGLSAEESELSAWEIYGAVEQLIGENNSLGGLAIWALISWERSMAVPSETGYEAEVQFKINVKARVRAVPA